MKKNKSYTVFGLSIVTIFFFISIIINVLRVLLNLIQSQSFELSSLMSMFSLVVLVVVVFGFLYIYKGRWEFGPNHEKSVTIARRLVTFGIPLAIFGGFFISPLFSDFSVTYAISLTIFNSPILLAFVYLIKELAESKIQKILWLSFIFLIIIVTITNWALYESFAESTWFISDLYVYFLSISIIPYIMLTFCYYKTYMKLKESKIAV